jgi:hypothetical protein
VLGLVLALALAPNGASAWSSGRSTVISVNPRPVCCVSHFQTHPFVFQDGFLPRHHAFVAPPVSSFLVVKPQPVWIPGFWAWNGFTWVLAPGHWGW